MRLSRKCAGWLALLACISLARATGAQAQARKVFNPPGMPSNLPFSNGIQVGNMLWIAGVEGVVSGDIEAETRTALDNVRKVLDLAGYKPSEVVQVTVYLKDIDD